MKTVWRLCRFCLSLLILSGCVSPGETVDVPDSSVDRARMNARAEAAAAPRLVRLVDERKQITLRPEDYADTALRDITRLTTPAGYRLKYRFLELGVPVAQGLSLSKDPQLQGRLLEVARFESGVKTRAESLLVLAAQKKPEHIKFFREALLDRNVALQFAALEALEAWALPEALPLLLDAANRGWSPLIRAYAAQVAWRRGAPEGKQMLLSFLSDTNWLMRSMAARYLGDWGEGKDAETILSRLGREGDNDFALAEICIAGLKLLARRGPPVPPPPPPRPRPGTPPPAVVSPLFELEPLIVTAPRLKVSGGQLVDPRIDSQLVALLDRLATKVRPDVVVQDPALVEVDQLVTPKGFGLKIRYSDISYLLTEGLAGTTNLTLITRMEDIARRSPDGGVRTAAYVSLGFDPTRVSLSIFQEGLGDLGRRGSNGPILGGAAFRRPGVGPAGRFAGSGYFKAEPGRSGLGDPRPLHLLSRAVGRRRRF